MALDRSEISASLSRLAPLLGGKDAVILGLERVSPYMVQLHESLKLTQAQLCEAIRVGERHAQTPNLLPALRIMAEDQLAIDQPSYRGISSP